MPIVSLEVSIANLPARHQAALRWFASRAGQETPWPRPLDHAEGAILLASRAKGIYKPEWSMYALSVRESLEGPYPDREPMKRTDGTWSYLYFQENEDPRERDSEFTNRGLVACWDDQVPVGVMRQVSRQPVRYNVLGLAVVAGWEEGYFLLEGFSPDGLSRGPGPAPMTDQLELSQEAQQNAEGVFDSHSTLDARERAIATIIRRRGQPAFRRALIELYDSRCAITGADAVQALEAAHILPYHGVHTNQPSNGLLLRSDLHVLFDLGLISINPSSMRVVISSELRNTAYADLEGRAVTVPGNPSLQPSPEALAQHLRWSGLDVMRAASM